MKRYVCTDCPDHCTLITNAKLPEYCVDTFERAEWVYEGPAESEAREEQEARAAMAVELRERDAHF